MRATSPYASRQSTGKTTNRPHFLPMYKPQLLKPLPEQVPEMMGAHDKQLIAPEVHHGIATAIVSHFCIAEKIARNFRNEKQNLAIFHRRTHRNRIRIVTAKKSPPRIWTSLWAPLAVLQCRWPYNESLRKIGAYNFERVNESQTSTANHRRETVHFLPKIFRSVLIFQHWVVHKILNEGRKNHRYHPLWL